MIAVHRVDLRDPVETSPLSPDEVERAASFHAEHGRQAFVACRSTLRRVLAARLGVAPAAVELSLSEHGRPGVAGGRVSFSVSHSGEIGLIAVAAGERRVGVDVERMRPMRDFEGLARSYFHPDEAAAIGDSPEAFFRCWTKKEAVVKALGLGLLHPLESFAVDVDGEGPEPVAGVPGVGVRALPIDEGYAAALAADGDVEYAWMP